MRRPASPWDFVWPPSKRVTRHAESGAGSAGRRPGIEPDNRVSQRRQRATSVSVYLGRGLEFVAAVAMGGGLQLLALVAYSIVVAAGARRNTKHLRHLHLAEQTATGAPVHLFERHLYSALEPAPSNAFKPSMACRPSKYGQIIWNLDRTYRVLSRRNRGGNVTSYVSGREGCLLPVLCFRG